MTLPKISIVTPSFNQAPFVEETIKSVLDQNYPNLEYIVIDGGSTDGSVDIIKKYQSRLSYFVSEPDSGHGNALNKGFARSSGEIMAWLNSDDKYCPWTFQTVAEIFETFPFIHWITGLHGKWSDRGSLIEARGIYKNAFDFLDGNYGWIQQESVFWRRGLWERVGGYIDENFKFMVDGELWSRFFLNEGLWHLHGVLGGYRVHKDNRAKHRRENCIAEMERVVGQMRRAVTQQNVGDMQDLYLMLHYDEDALQWRQEAISRKDFRSNIPG